MLTNIDHIGIAVNSLEEAIIFYEKILGLTCSSQEEVPSQQVKIAFFKVNNTCIELLEATSAESPIAKFIAKNGSGIHHIAYETDDIRAQLAQAKSNGARLINEEPLIGAHNKLVAFIHPKSSLGVLTEFCQTNH